MKRALIVLIAALAGVTGGAAPPARPATTEILWDTYGVPHIFASDDAGLFHAFGCAQVQSHGDVLLRLYGRARGRAAEYWGEKYRDEDRWVRTNGVPARAEVWYSQQRPSFRRLLDAFAEGINACAEARRADLADEVEVVLPVKPSDIMAHAQRVIHFTFMAGMQQAASLAARRAAQAAPPDPPPMASNAWAIAPRRSAGGAAMLLANPHLQWSDQTLFYEAQLAGPTVNAYGATLVGFPVLGIAFTDRLGWTHTVNTLDETDFYQLTPAGGGYRLDGAVRAFDVEQQTITVKGADGVMRTEPLAIRRSVHGPVVADGTSGPIALRVAGLDRPGALEQWWDMARARDMRGFVAVVKRLQIPVFAIIYADRDGHILHIHNGQVPVRPPGRTDWWSTVPGDTSATLWKATHRYEDLPIVIDPPSGWLQSSNDPPWTTTFPAVLDPRRFPTYLTGQYMSFRTRRSIRLLMDAPPMTLSSLVQAKFSTRMELADRILDDVLAAARTSPDEIVREAAAVLERWDRTADAGSRGAVLFESFVRRMWSASKGRPFETPWDPARPLDTPKGLVNMPGVLTALKEAATDLQGRLDVAWGEVYRMRGPRGEDLPSNGGPGNPFGIFHVVQYSDRQANYGDSYIAAVQFSNPLRAHVLTAYGNSSQPGSPHAGDQLALLAKKQLRTAWRTREEILAHLERREELPYDGRPAPTAAVRGTGVVRH